MLVPVVQGLRYAIGLSVPFFAGWKGPVAELKDATAQAGFANLGEDTAAGQWAKSRGWSNVVAYKGDRAPVTAPGPADYVLIATRAGESTTIDTNADEYQGIIAWVEKTDAQPSAPPRGSSSSSSATPWGWIAVGGAVLIGTAAIVLSGDGRSR